MKTSPRRAESLVESIIAVTVIVLATTAAMSLIRTSISGNRVIGDKVIAMNLALEGIEAVRNVRDTNYLNYASAADDCWDAIDAESLDECDSSGSNTANHMDPGTTYYLKRIVLDSDYRYSWQITTNSNNENITLYQIYEGDASTEAGKLYAQSGLESLDSDYFGVIEEGIYTRSLAFTTNSHNSTDAIDVTVTVGWESKGQTYSVDLTRTISNVY